MVDARNGASVNRDLAEDHLPVSADVVSVEAILIETDEADADAAGIRGIGELRHHRGQRHGRALPHLPIRSGDRPG